MTGMRTAKRIVRTLWLEEDAIQTIAEIVEEETACDELYEALKGLVPLIEKTFPKQQHVWLEEARSAMEKYEGIEL